MKTLLTSCLVLALSLPVFAQGECITEEVSPPAMGYAMEKQVGLTFCAPPGGAIMRNHDGEIVCATGHCLTGNDGEIICSSVPNGDAFVDGNGVVKCVEGCMRPAHRNCRRPSR